VAFPAIQKKTDIAETLGNPVKRLRIHGRCCLAGLLIQLGGQAASGIFTRSSRCSLPPTSPASANAMWNHGSASTGYHCTASKPHHGATDIEAGGEEENLFVHVMTALEARAGA